MYQDAWPKRGTSSALSTWLNKVQPRRVVHFAAVSGIGLLIDLTLFIALIDLGLGAFPASVASSSAAVTFVYLASVWRVFRYGGRFQLKMFAIYALYQLCGISAGSWAVQFLVSAGLPGGLAKLSIVPLTFSANYLFMSWLTADPGRWQGKRS